MPRYLVTSKITKSVNISLKKKKNQSGQCHSQNDHSHPILGWYVPPCITEMVLSDILL